MKKKTAILALALSAMAASACAQVQDVKEAAPPASVTFLDSKLFDNMLSKELGANKETVEVTITGKMSLNSIPARVDTWITAVGENGELTLRPQDPALKPKFILGLIPIVYSFIKQQNIERTFEPAKKYNASIIYHVDRNGESLIDKIVFVRKKEPVK
ncbi:MAG: hypothetical protein V4633_10000 [Pseudomonadota bacterium]